MAKKSFYFEIFAVSLAAILLEISYTRIFSFKVIHYFTYLIIGIALLGLGTGGVLVAISRRLREADTGRLISKLSFAGGACVLASYFFIALAPLNIHALIAEPIEIPKLLGVSILLMIPFSIVGIIVSTILSVRPESASRLYGTDLIGAALGCLLCIPLMELLDPPRVVILAGLILTIAGFPAAIRSALLRTVGAAIGIVLMLFLLQDEMLPEPIVDKGKPYDKSRASGLVSFSKWNPVFRVDVSLSPLGGGPKYLIHHDGLVGSGLHEFDGDFADNNQNRNFSSRAAPFEVLADAPRVLIIGSAGGYEILASLFFGASHVTGVELNPVTISLLTDVYSDFTGRLHENPRVTLINGDGRWFLKQTQNKYDLIWFVNPDSYAAMNASTSGSFVLSESYLYTVEMISESLEHLTDQGIICALFGEFDIHKNPLRTLRYLSTARQAFTESDILPFSDHVTVSIGSSGIRHYLLSTVILSNQPLAKAQVERLRETVRLDKGKVRYVPGRTKPSTIYSAITIPDSEIEGWLAAYPFRIDPIYDDSPFFWHFTRFRDALKELGRIGNYDYSTSFEYVMGEQVSIVLLTLIIVCATFFLFLPFVFIRKIWLEIPYKWRTGVYFASLGLGFMFFEVALIQMLTLLLGYPTYSLSVTLFGILVFSGIGSILSGRYASQRNRALGILLAILAGLMVFYNLGMHGIIESALGYPLAVRVLLAVTMIAPLGLCLGAFLPIGIGTVAKTTQHSREYVAWAWAVNGFFSVMASILSTILAMAIGFKLVLLLAVGIYAIGVCALILLPQEG